MAITLPPNRLQRSEHYFSNYTIVLDAGQTLEDALKPEFWAHVAKQMRQHDIVRIIPEDGSYFVEAVVLRAERLFAMLKVLREIPLVGVTPVEIEEPASADSLTVKWGGPHLKWTVLRKSDGERIKDSLTDKASAELWARDYLNTIAN